MKSVLILNPVALRLEFHAARLRRQSLGQFDELAKSLDRQAMRIREAIALIERGEFRQFEFKGIGYTRLPSGRIVRSA